MKRFTLAAGAALVMSMALPATAATIDPNDFELILTEGKRTTTIDGADISGNAARRGNRGIGRFTIGDLSGPFDVLMAGRVARTGRDQWESRNVTGWLQFDVLNYTATRSSNTDPFGALFELIIDGVVTQSTVLSGTNRDLLSFSFAPVLLDSADVRLRVKSQEGRSSYDISASVQPISLGASLPFLVTAGGVMAVAGRRRKAN